jgi:hypothetical protein
MRIAVQLFEDVGPRAEQTDLGLLGLLETFDIHPYAGTADALRHS